MSLKQPTRESRYCCVHKRHEPFLPHTCACTHMHMHTHKHTQKTHIYTFYKKFSSSQYMYYRTLHASTHASTHARTHTDACTHAQTPHTHTHTCIRIHTDILKRSSSSHHLSIHTTKLHKHIHINLLESKFKKVCPHHLFKIKYSWLPQCYMVLWGSHK